MTTTDARLLAAQEALWDALKARCAADPEKALRLVMVSKDDLSAAMRAALTAPVEAAQPVKWAPVDDNHPSPEVLRAWSLFNKQRKRDYYDEGEWEAFCASLNALAHPVGAMGEEAVKHIDRLYTVAKRVDPLDCEWLQQAASHTKALAEENERLTKALADTDETATALAGDVSTYQARIRELEAAQGTGEGWQPIETAPRDGRHIHVGWLDGGIGFGIFNGVTVPMQTVAHWFGPADLPGLRAGGWYPSVQTNDGNEKLHPTHWKPLAAPQPPAPMSAPYEGVTWDQVKDAVDDALNNGEGRTSAYYIEYALTKAGIGVYGLPDHPVLAPAPMSEDEP